MEASPEPAAVNIRPAGELFAVLLGGLDLAEAVVTAVPDGRRTATTPCPQFNVEQLAGHLIAGMAWFAGLPASSAVPRSPGAGSPAAGSPGVGPVGDLRAGDGRDLELGGLPLGATFAVAARAVRRCWTAAAVDQVYLMPWGPADGREMAAFMAIEVIGHAWDLSTATGQPRYPVDELAAAALEVARELDQETLRSPGMVGPPVAVGADAQPIDRLVAFLGRDPRWRALI